MGVGRWGVGRGWDNCQGWWHGVQLETYSVQRQGYVCLNSPSLLSFYFPVVDLANNCREVQGAAI